MGRHKLSPSVTEYVCKTRGTIRYNRGGLGGAVIGWRTAVQPHINCTAYHGTYDTHFVLQLRTTNFAISRFASTYLMTSNMALESVGLDHKDMSSIIVRLLLSFEELSKRVL
jgi:hypothetical protein